MLRPSISSMTVVLALVLEMLAAAPGANAATPEQTCRTAADKAVAKVYQQALGGMEGCFKTRIKTSGATTNCLNDPLAYDAGGKVATASMKLAEALAPAGSCGALGTQFGPVCGGASAACAAACATCATGAGAAQCLSCRILELTKTQVGAVYGNPPDLSANATAQKCQNSLGKDTGKYARARMKEQQKCQQAVSKNKFRLSCAGADIKGKIKKANAKASGKVLGTCLQSPGSDQIPSLDTTATCLTGSATTATACALDTAAAAIDAIFALATKPGSVRGFVMATTAAGGLVPLPGARLEVLGAAVGQHVDRNGAYALQGLPPGAQMIAVDGQGVGSYPRIVMGVPVAMVGETPMGIFVMPEIDMANALDITALSTDNLNGSRTMNAPTTLTNPTIPGASLDLPAGTVITFDVANRAPLITLSMVPYNVMPFPGGGVFSDQIFSFQPENTTVSPPVNATFPNNTGLPDGSSVNIYLPDFLANTFNLAGTATVNGGGTLVTSDAPVIGSFDWHFVSPPPDGCMTTVIGRVVNQVTLLPVAGASVLVQGATTVSAADGTFSLPNISCAAFFTSASASAVTPTGLATGSASAAIVFFGTTDVGDLLIIAPDCGDGFTVFPEQCDDGNHTPGDGCTATCVAEVCGNAIVDPAEECDGTPGCGPFCTLCGNGLVRIPGEECDLGAQNGVPGSGCSARCLVSICGNGIEEDGEECDDGPANGGSFCDTTCQLQPPSSTFIVPLVRQTLPCNDVGGPPANAITAGSVPSCMPPPLDSAFQFGPVGVGSFTAGLVLGGSDAVVSASLRDVRDAGNVAIAAATGWRLRVVVRVTVDGAANAATDATLSNVTILAPATLTAPGSLDVSAALAAATAGDFTAYTSHSIEIVDVAILDPTDAVFAAPGFLLRQPPLLTEDAPVSASGGNMPLVQAHVGCGTPGGNSPNTSINGIAACSPPETPNEQSGSPPNGWRFGPSGVIGVAYFAGGTDVLLKIVGNAIQDASGLVNAAAGTLTFVMRSTIRDPGGEMSMIDFQLSTPTAVNNGKLAVKDSFDAMLGAIAQPPFPATQGSFVGNTVVSIDPIGTPVLIDANGVEFARLGIKD